jgi:hypothetical protein
MGTNYYWEGGDGRGRTRLHIGKSSNGWCFSLHVIASENIHDLEDWERVWQTCMGKILNEYGDKISPEQMRKIITERRVADRQWREPPYGYDDWPAFHADNFSELGPNGLLRHQLTEGHCIKQGAGTWDCIIGVFS